MLGFDWRSAGAWSWEALLCLNPAAPCPALAPNRTPPRQVGVEKEKVNAENAAAQAEADACAAIAAEVAELQARCEAELAAAEPLVAQAEEALNTLTKKDLGGWGWGGVDCSC